LIHRGEFAGLTPDMSTTTGSLIRPSGRALRPHPDPTNHAGFPQGFTSRSTELSKNIHILRTTDASSPRGGCIGRSGPSPRPIRSPVLILFLRADRSFCSTGSSKRGPAATQGDGRRRLADGAIPRAAGAIRPGRLIASDSTRRRVTLFGRFAGFRQESRPAGATPNPLITPDLPVWFIRAPNVLRGHRAGPIRATDDYGRRS
jgi:hypothetical protein